MLVSNDLQIVRQTFAQPCVPVDSAPAALRSLSSTLGTEQNPRGQPEMNAISKTLFAALFLHLAGCSSYTTVGGAPAYHRGLSDESTGFTFLIGADPATFQRLKGDGYAKDKDHVFYQGRKVEGAQSATFIALSNDYGRDSISGFYQSEPIPGSDGQTLEVLPRMWVRDKNDVYAGTNAIHACDPATFRNLDYSWHVDSRCAYAGALKIVGADPKTFQVINSTFAKDAIHVYSSVGRIVAETQSVTAAIPGADPATFHLIGGKCGVCARDEDYCYSWNEVVSCDRFK